MAASWRDALGSDRLLVTGFGKWGGGVYDLTGGRPVALDDLPTSGMALGGDRLWRVLRAPGEQTGTCELLSYDTRGVRSYVRLDRIRDPHDVCWHHDAIHVASSWDDAIWRIGHDGRPELWWQGGRVPDSWHVNSLLVVGGSLHVCALGRSDRYRGWKAANSRRAGFVHDLDRGRDVLTGLAHPHTPRWAGDRWYVCESAIGALTELSPAGTRVRRSKVGRFTRGLAVVGRWALVGGNAHRQSDEDRGEIAVVDLRTFTVIERIPMPCSEVYDVVAVPVPLARGVRIGFGTNPARAVEQQRAGGRNAGRPPVSADTTVRLVTPRVAAELVRMGQPMARDVARRFGVRSRLPRAATAGDVVSLEVTVVNGSHRPLGSVVPRPVTVGARWLRVTADQRGPELPNPTSPLPHVIPPGERLAMTVVLEVPAQPGTYELRVALRQSGLGWFGRRASGTVAVTTSGDGEPRSDRSAAATSGPPEAPRADPGAKVIA